MKKLIVLLLVVASPCWAQQKKKPRVADKKFWLATAVVIGATILDVESTASCFRDHTCAEGNAIFGRHPSRAKMYAIKAPVAAVVVAGTWWWKKDDTSLSERAETPSDSNSPQPAINKPRASWYLPAAALGGVWGGAGIHNLLSKKKSRTPPLQAMDRPGN